MSKNVGGSTSQSQMDQLRALEMEKEALKEGEYRELFSNLIRKHSSTLLTELSINKDQEYKEEMKILKNVLSMEQNAILSGMAIGLTAFVSLRFGPKWILKSSKVGSQKLQEKLSQQQQQSQKKALLQKATAFLIESTFGLWAGWKAYHGFFATTLSNGNGNHSYEQSLADIPLVSGKSKLSESLCNDWIQITKHQIPSAFWEYQKDNQNNGNSSWKYIQRFADNCMQRQALEKDGMKNQRKDS